MAADVLGVGVFQVSVKHFPLPHPRPSIWSRIRLSAIICDFLHLHCSLTGIPGGEETDTEILTPVIWKLSWGWGGPVAYVGKRGLLPSP